VKKIRYLMGVALLLAGAVALSGCALDVIATGSVTAFSQMLAVVPGGAVWDEGELWVPAPDGGAKLVLSGDWSKTGMDAYLRVDAAPFLAAGLDTGKLAEGYAAHDGVLDIGLDLGQDGPGASSPDALYGALVAKRPDLLEYHMSMDHFVLNLGLGMFEWAKDFSQNDKDIVFALDPAPLVEAGLDPQGVEGWTYAEVETMDAYGAHVKVLRLLKPFDIA
jgi:hypothetical protein